VQLKTRFTPNLSKMFCSSRTAPKSAFPAPPGATHTFKVKAPLLAKDKTLCLLGNCAALGNWNPAAPVFLNRTAADDFLSAQIDLGRETFPISYKYGVYDVEIESSSV